MLLIPRSSVVFNCPIYSSLLAARLGQLNPILKLNRAGEIENNV